jgi:hypothetical protein
MYWTFWRNTVIEYKSGYKYQLASDYRVLTSIKPVTELNSGFLTLHPSGMLHISAGYAWDGCSGPTVDTKSTMRAGLVHDALYQLTRADLLSQSRRRDIDKEFHKILREDGMWKPRAWYYYQAVRRFGLSASSAENRKKVHRAP